MIEEISVSRAVLPMARPFAHAGAWRNQSASVLVTVRARGKSGWGEGAPRPYVTGESVTTAQTALRNVNLNELNRMLDLSDFPSAMQMLSQLDFAKIVGNSRRMPAAGAALEIALFDLLCRIHQRDGPAALSCVPALAAVVGPVAACSPVSFVLDLVSDGTDEITGMDVEAIEHIKVKATPVVADCVQRITQVRDMFGPKASISVDVNGAWTPDQALRGAEALVPLGVAWIEEPVAPRDWTAMAAIRRETGMAVMLDESCTTLADLHAAADGGSAELINVRISKCGGIFPALGMIRDAHECGMGAQLGVHVGEIGPLWGAARLLTSVVRGLVAVEAGKHDAWFPEPLTVPANVVDRRRYTVAPLIGPGIGLSPGVALNRWLSSQQEIEGITT